MARDQSDVLKELIKNAKDPKVVEQAQLALEDAKKRKAEIAAEMKGSVVAPLAKSVGPLNEVTTPAGKETRNEKIAIDMKSLLKESKDQNTSLKKIISLNEKSIEDNSEFYARLEKTMNALLDSLQEQGRKGEFKGSKESSSGIEKTPNKNDEPENGGGFNPLDLLGMGKGSSKTSKGKSVKTKNPPSRLRRIGRGIGGAVAGGILGAGIYGMLSPEQQEFLNKFGIDEDTAGAAGAVLGGGAGALSGNTPKTKPVEPTAPKTKPVEPTAPKTKPVEPTAPKTEPVVETTKPVVEPEPRYKFNEKTGRFHDTMKGIGGGEMISDAKAKELGLEKPVVETTKPVVEPVEPAVPKTETTAPKIEPVTPKPPSTTAKVIEGAKVAGKELKAGSGGKGGAIIGAVLGVGLNEFFGEVSELKKAREEIVSLYKKKEISEEDAVDALEEIDKKISESRGGSIVREGSAGAVGGVVGTATATGLAATGVGAIAAPAAGFATGTGAAMLYDKFAGETMEKGGRIIGGAIHSLFGKSKKQLAEELKQPTKEEEPKNNVDNSTDPQAIYDELLKNDPIAQKDEGARADLKREAHMQAKANIAKEKGVKEISGYVETPLKDNLPEENNKKKEEVPKGNVAPGVTPDIDMGFQIEGRKEFDKGLVNNQASIPGVTPDVSGIMPSAGGDYETPETPKKAPEAKISPKAEFDAATAIDEYVKYSNSNIDSLLTYMQDQKPETILQKVQERLLFDAHAHRLLGNIPRNKRKQLDDKLLESINSKLQKIRITQAESSDTGNLGSGYQATEITPEVTTPTVDIMGNVGGYETKGGEEVQSAMEAARASDEGNMGLITQKREISPEMEKSFIQTMRKERRRQFGPNSFGLDALTEDMYSDNANKNVLPTSDQIVSTQDAKNIETTGPNNEKISKLSQSVPSQTSAPIIINNQGGDTYNTTTNSSGGSSSGGAGGPSRMPNPYDAMVFGRTWEAYP